MKALLVIGGLAYDRHRLDDRYRERCCLFRFLVRELVHVDQCHEAREQKSS
jgi:hypothetical protein